jgi:hypothetical protein
VACAARGKHRVRGGWDLLGEAARGGCSPGRYPYTFYSFKASAQFDVRWGILLSVVYRYQAGQNYARLIVPSAPSSCACTFSAADGGPGSSSQRRFSGRARLESGSGSCGSEYVARPRP